MSRIIGPFLGARGPGRIRIVIGLPDSTHTQLNCQVVDSGGVPIQPQVSRAQYATFKSFVFDFQSLVESERYSYVISDGNGPVDLGPDLCWSDCYFYGPAGFSSHEDYFVFLSCNDPFAENDYNPHWAMWERLEQETRDQETRDEVNCRLLLLGGDQVYCDEVEERYKRVKFNMNEDQLRQAFITKYHSYWQHTSIRKVFARIPSLAMWDDHDITDGWGSREEFFNGQGAIQQVWQLYFDVAKQAFEAYQAVRNPKPIAIGGYTSYLDNGNIRIYLLDFRSERNFKIPQLWSQNNHNDFMHSLSYIPEDIGKVFVLSPSAAPITDILTKLGELACKLPGLSCKDDLIDSLTSRVNIGAFGKILKKLFELRDNGKYVAILAGDIHIAGLSVFIRRQSWKDLDINKIPQIVSSPIAAEPEGIVKLGLRKRGSNRKIWSYNKSTYLGKNVFHKSERNYVTIYPNRQSLPSGIQLLVRYYFQSDRHPTDREV